MQADFVERYGPQVIVASSDRPIKWLTAFGILVLFATAAGLAVRVRSWRKKAEAGAVVLRPSDVYDERLEGELRDFE